MKHAVWYTGHVPRRLQRALSMPVRPSRVPYGVVGYGGHIPRPDGLLQPHEGRMRPFPPPYTRKTGDSLVASIFKYWPLRTDLMETVDWTNFPSIPVLRQEVSVPGLPTMLDNRPIGYQPPSPRLDGNISRGISSFALSRGLDERRQRAQYGNMRLQ
jgi:hypothetical protein